MLPAMARTSRFDLYDRILGGQLASILTGMRAEGLSIVDVTFRLRALEVHVSTDTVARWLRQVEGDTGAQAVGQ